MSESGDTEGQEATLQDRGGQGETAGVCSWKRMMLSGCSHCSPVQAGLPAQMGTSLYEPQGMAGVQWVKAVLEGGQQPLPFPGCHGSS